MAVRVLAALLIATAVPSTAGADWIRVRSANFLFVSDAPERDVRRAAVWLEQFRQAMLQALPDEFVASPVPTIVVAFGRSRAFESYTPLFGDRPMDDVSGFFVGYEDRNYIVANLGRGDRAFATILHEYAHFLVGNAHGEVPVWADEGLAQYYESFLVREDGIAIVGMPLAEHIDALRRTRLMPLDDLLAVDRESPTYNRDAHGRGLFYAQSWALVHYLLRGGPARDGQLGRYLARVRNGEDAGAAFADVFGDAATLEDEIGDYVNQSRMTAVAFRLDPDPAAGDGPVEALDDHEADTYLGDLLARVGRVEAGRARLEAILADHPDMARASTSLGLIALREGRLDAALPLLERGADGDPDDPFTLGAFGRALIDRLALERGDAFAATLRRAREVLDRAVALDPGSAEISALAGHTATLDGDVDVALARLRHAVGLAPTREAYELMLAQALIAAGDWDGASATLDRLAGQGRTARTRERALELMTRMVTARIAATPTPPPVARPAPAASAPDPAPQRTPPPVTVSRPVLRPVEAGETRVVGRLRGVMCQGGTRLIVVETSEGLLRLRRHASRAFVYTAYVAGAPASIACGELQPTRRVLATYVAPAPPARPNVDGDAVAIEIVPDGFTP
jgi:hypothetical protein